MTALCATSPFIRNVPEPKSRLLARGLKPRDQLLQQRVERFLLGLGQRQQEPLLVGDMAAERVVDHALAWVGQHNQFVTVDRMSPVDELR
jgi:hypothetical protein